MANKSLTPLVLACLALTGPALALASTEPLPPQMATSTPATTSSDTRVGINKDGSLRQPTAEEQQQLDAQKTKRSSATIGKATVDGRSKAIAPRSEREALTTLKTAPSGMRSMAVPEDLMSSMTVTRRADGTLVISENRDSDANHGRPSQEAAHE